MRQTSFFSPEPREHGGSLSVNKRRSRRVLSTRESIHLTLRSNFANGNRSLLCNQEIVNHVMRKAECYFRIKVYRHAICGNHLHLLIRGKTRGELQNFFRVFAGHTAQMILNKWPLTELEKLKLKSTQTGVKKNQRQFWEMLTYTRIITWGREFARVANYILRNTLEALNVIAYRPRKRIHRPKCKKSREPP